MTADINTDCECTDVIEGLPYQTKQWQQKWRQENYYRAYNCTTTV